MCTHSMFFLVMGTFFLVIFYDDDDDYGFWSVRNKKRERKRWLEKYDFVLKKGVHKSIFYSSLKGKFHWGSFFCLSSCFKDGELHYNSTAIICIHIPKILEQIWIYKKIGVFFKHQPNMYILCCLICIRLTKNLHFIDTCIYFFAW